MLLACIGIINAKYSVVIVWFSYVA